ncbi:MAG: hypothetical protein GAK31_01699 [Stenotrophomonas maltophilia]|uniref:Transmembrane protein n=1 Tax=Stenotrophomonas maltophilia TaxID=40324 RepID=A0A7V8JML0_STEMA|nr:MAG: hypothetical protein GAK31_01699 [Stenotrophomonas maltophilia]
MLRSPVAQGVACGLLLGVLAFGLPFLFAALGFGPLHYIGSLILVAVVSGVAAEIRHRRKNREVT